MRRFYFYFQMIVLNDLIQYHGLAPPACRLNRISSDFQQNARRQLLLAFRQRLRFQQNA